MEAVGTNRSRRSSLVQIIVFVLHDELNVTEQRPISKVDPATVEADGAGWTAVLPWSRRYAAVLSFAFYLLVALAFTAKVWVHGPTRFTVLPQQDSASFIWANGWVAHALAHLENPFFSSRLFAPGGINLIGNPYSPGAGIISAPITWIFGPILSYNLDLIAALALSGLAMLLAARRFTHSEILQVFAGGMWAFSPFAVTALTFGWTDFVYLVTPPLMVLFADELLRRQRWSPIRLGLAIATTAFVQLFMGPELLALSAVMMTIGVGASIGWMLIRARPTLQERSSYLVRSLLIALISSLVLLSGPAIYAAAGPRHLLPFAQPRWLSVWNAIRFQQLVRPNTSLASYASFTGLRLANSTLLGIGLLLIAIGTIIWLHRRGEVLLLGFIAGIGIWLARGSFALFHPWGLIWRLPLLRNVLPSRFALVPLLCAILLAVVGIDAIVNRLSASSRPGAWAAGVVSVLVAASSFALVIVQMAPLRAVSEIPVDPWLSGHAPTPAASTVLTYPAPSSPRRHGPAGRSRIRFLPCRRHRPNPLSLSSSRGAEHLAARATQRSRSASALDAAGSP